MKEHAAEAQTVVEKKQLLRLVQKMHRLLRMAKQEGEDIGLRIVFRRSGSGRKADEAADSLLSGDR
jgi:hypothetical protein